MKLHYLGHEPGGAIPLPEGWPAFDHVEENAEVASLKLASGKYEVIADDDLQAAPGDEAQTLNTPTPVSEAEARAENEEQGVA